MPIATTLARSSILYSSMQRPHAAHPARGIDALTCPECGRHSLKQIHRRGVDRLLSPFVTLRRFTCRDPQCQWVGNITKASSRPIQHANARTHLLLLILCLALLALVIGVDFLHL